MDTFYYCTNPCLQVILFFHHCADMVSKDEKASSVYFQKSPKLGSTRNASVIIATCSIVTLPFKSKDQSQTCFHLHFDAHDIMKDAQS